MKPPATEKGIRPGVLAVAALLCVALVVLIWMSKRAPAPAKETSPQASLLTEAATASAPVPPEPTAAPVPTNEITVFKPLAEQGGIQVTSVALLHSGTELEILYTVVDPEKVNSISDAGIAPYLLDEATGTKLPMGPPSAAKADPTQMAPVRASSAHSRARSAALMNWEAGSFPPLPNRVVAGKTYSVIIPNPRGVVRSGSKVDVVLGAFRTDGITVE